LAICEKILFYYDVRPEQQQLFGADVTDVLVISAR
jgi:hypothetical protein